MRGILSGRNISGRIAGSGHIIGIYDGVIPPEPEPEPPAPSRGDHYTGQLTDSGHSRYITLWIMEKEDII